MRETNLAAVDLNLLPALEALLRRRNVTRAAEDVGLSQPAMSRALQRLRDVLGDPLLARGAGGLAPTPRALELLPQLSAALDALGSVYRAPAFEPRDMRRTFAIAAADAQTVLIAPLLLKRVRTQAPGVDLRFEPYGENLRERMEAGAIDLAFATLATPLPPGALNEPLVEDRLALVLREGHPGRARAWTLADYAEAAHVTIAIRGDEESEIDSALARRGAARRIVLRTPHFMAALAAVGASDAVTTISETLARRFAGVFGLALLEPPFADVPLHLSLVGTAARAADPALTWLKGLIREAAAEAFGAVQSCPGPGVAR
jgi:DNA-binding transcriptional LysR family regulator